MYAGCTYVCMYVCILWFWLWYKPSVYAKTLGGVFSDENSSLKVQFIYGWSAVDPGRVCYICTCIFRTVANIVFTCWF